VTITILQGDVVEQLRTLPDCSVQCCVTSPPYDNLRTYKDNPTFDILYVVNELYRVLKAGGVVVWVVGDQIVNGSESGTSFRHALAFIEGGFNLHDTMIYEKTGCVFPDSTRYQQMFEYMFVFSKGKPSIINLIQDRVSKTSAAWGKRTYRNTEGALIEKSTFITGEVKKVGVRGNIWRYANGYGFSAEEDVAYKHPAIFPEKLVEDHIKTWSNEWDTILDPFGGSGTTGKMARKLKRKCILIEINPEYVKIMKDRLRLNEQLVF